VEEKRTSQNDVQYLVTLTDNEVPQIVVCKTLKEVANLLLGLKKEYYLVRVDSLGDNVYNDYKEFVQVDENIEFGKKEEGNVVK